VAAAASAGLILPRLRHGAVAPARSALSVAASFDATRDRSLGPEAKPRPRHGSGQQALVPLIPGSRAAPV